MVQISTASVFAQDIIGPLAGIADLDMALFGNQWRLFATNERESSVSVFDVLGLEQPSVAFAAQSAPGGQIGATDLDIVTTATGTFAVFSGGQGGSYNTYEIAADGKFGTASALMSGTGAGTSLTAVSAVSAGGSGVVAASGSGQQGFTVSTFDSDLTLTGSQDIDIENGQVADVEVVVIGNARITIALDAARNEILSYIAGEDGTLVAADSLGVIDGLGLVGPDILAIAQVDGLTYGLVAAGNSSSISVFEITEAGEMIARDHVIDGQGTRFASVSELQIVESAGRSFVLAAGADNGVTLLELLPGGRLLHHATIEDNPDIGLQNVSGLVGRVMDGVLHVFVASSTEAGLTHLTFVLGQAGQVRSGAEGDDTLTGGAGDDVLFGGHGSGNDVLYGKGGDDILVAGHGTDQLHGGAGADVFVFGDAHQGGVVRDFSVVQDYLDLSGWTLLQDASQLQFLTNGNRLDIGFQGYSVTLYSDDGSILDPDAVATRIIINPGHSMVTDAPGTTGNIHQGTSGDDVMFGSADDDIFYGGEGADTFAGGDGFDIVSYENATGPIIRDMIFTSQNQGAIADDVFSAIEGVEGTGFADVINGDFGGNWIAGGAGSDTLAGRRGDDELLGGSGYDTLSGGRGADTLTGGEGDDLLKGNKGGDDLSGGAGHDELRGGGGHDTLAGGTGNDTLTGGSGFDEFRFVAGSDVITDFDAGLDVLVIDAALLADPMMTAQQILDAYGQDLGGSVRLDFGLDPFGVTNMITLDGVVSLADLLDSLFTF